MRLQFSIHTIIRAARPTMLACLAFIALGCSSTNGQTQHAPRGPIIQLVPARASSAALPGPLMNELKLQRSREGMLTSNYFLDSRNDHLLGAAPGTRQPAYQYGITIVDDTQWTINGRPRNSVRIRQRSVRYHR